MFYYVTVGGHYLAQDFKFYARPAFAWFSSSESRAKEYAAQFNGSVTTVRP